MTKMVKTLIVMYFKNVSFGHEKHFTKTIQNNSLIKFN